MRTMRVFGFPRAECRDAIDAKFTDPVKRTLGRDARRGDPLASAGACLILRRLAVLVG